MRRFLKRKLPWISKNPKMVKITDNGWLTPQKLNNNRRTQHNLPQTRIISSSMILKKAKKSTIKKQMRWWTSKMTQIWKNSSKWGKKILKIAVCSTRPPAFQTKEKTLQKLKRLSKQGRQMLTSNQIFTCELWGPARRRIMKSRDSQTISFQFLPTSTIRVGRVKRPKLTSLDNNYFFRTTRKLGKSKLSQGLPMWICNLRNRKQKEMRT